MLIPTGASASASAGFDTTLIGNSIWLDGSADGLTKPASEFDAEDGKEFTLGTWFQLTEFGVAGALFCAGNGSGVYTSLRHAADNKIYLQTEAGSHILSTTAVFRDVAWYHVLVSVDTTQATNTNRVKFFINGVEATLTGTYPAENHAYDFNLASVHEVGDSYENGAFEGYLAQSFMIGTKSIQQSDFAITDFLDSQTFGSNGSQFIPKEHSEIKTLVDAGSDNSFLLDFSDSGGTDAANLGNDISSNNNDFTPTSMAAANQSSNTPSLVYANMDVLKNDGANTSTMVFSEGNTRVTGTGGSDGGSFSTLPLPTSGTTEFQATFNNGDGAVGICAYENLLAVSSSSSRNAVGGLGVNYNAAYGYQENGEKVVVLAGGVTRSAQGAALTTNSVLTVRYNADDNEITFLKDNVAQGSAVATVAGLTYYAFAARFNNYDVSFHFESAKFPHTIGSGNLEINSANLTAPDAQGVDHFAVTLAQEGSLLSAMGTAESAFSGYLRFYKSRASASATETWGFSFSHDASNEYILPANNTDMTYGSLRSLSGTDNWAGYSLNISSSAGTAAGSQAHSNGSDTTVTHNLGSSRYIVLLFSRSGSDIFYYHPDVSAGNLLALNTNVLPFSSTVITDITANTFDIGAAAASATYDYCVLAETPGVIDVFSYTGNSSTNGPFIPLNAQPEFLTSKLTVTHATEHIVVDRAREPFNDSSIKYLLFNQLTAEADSTAFATDFLSGAAKLRNSSTDMNSNTLTFVGWSFGKIAGNGTLPPVYGQ